MEHRYEFQVCVNGRAQMWTLWAKDYETAVTEVYRRLGPNGHIVHMVEDHNPNGIDVL